MKTNPEPQISETKQRSIDAFVECFANQDWDQAERWADIVFSSEEGD